MHRVPIEQAKAAGLSTRNGCEQWAAPASASRSSTRHARPYAPASGLRVLMLNSYLNGGGVDSQTLALCEALLTEGCQVTLAAPISGAMLDAAHAIERLEVLALRGKPAVWPLLLAGVLRARRINVIHAHHGRDYGAALLLGLLSGRKAPVVVTRHLMTRLSARTRFFLAHMASVIAVSDAALNSVAAVNAGRRIDLCRIHCGIDVQRFRPDPFRRADVRRALGWPADAYVFLLVGGAHLPEGKGHLVFVGAAAQVMAAHPQSHFVYVGEGGLTPLLIRQSRQLGLESNFHSLPFTRDIESIMQAADALVHPAVGSEALGLVLLEAMSCGLPVVASALDGIGETFVDGLQGISVPPRDVDALAAAMIRLADEPRLGDRMGCEGRQRVVNHFGLNALGRETVQHYRDRLALRAPRLGVLPEIAARSDAATQGTPRRLEDVRGCRSDIAL